MARDPQPASGLTFGAILIASTLLLGGVLVFWQEQRLGLPYVRGEQLARHRSVLTGSAPSPWRYRVLAEWVAAGFVYSAELLHAPGPVVTGFLGLRLVQNALILLLGFAYYRRLGMDSRHSLIGVMVLGFAFTHALDNSDLSFNTYFDVLFYLLAALAVLSGKRASFLAIATAAALNRETSGLIPLLPVAEWAAHPRAWPADWRQRACLSALAVIIWLGIFVSLRVWCGPPPDGTNSTGLPLVTMNLSSPRTLMLVAVTLSTLPVLTLWEFCRLPAFIRGLFWLMVPVWFAVHVSMALANETRLFLVPVATVLIPGALYSRRPPA